MAEQLGAAGHGTEVGAGIAELLGVRQAYSYSHGPSSDSIPAAAPLGPPSSINGDSLE